jgi:hypothetical protein
VKRLEEMAAVGNPTVQMMLPMAELVGWLVLASLKPPRKEAATRRKAS